MSQINLVGPLVCQVDARPATVVKAFVVSMMLAQLLQRERAFRFPLSSFAFILAASATFQNF